MAVVTRTAVGTFDQATATTHAIAGVTIAAGNLAVLRFGYQSDTVTITSVADNAGNTWTTAVSVHSASGDNQTSAIAFLVVPAGGLSGATVTITLSATATCAGNLVYYNSDTGWLSQATVLDKTSGNNTGLVTAWTSNATATTTQADELLVGVAYSGGAINGGTNTASGGWTEEQEQVLTSSGYELVTEWQKVTATGAYAATGTWSAAEIAACCIATFKTAAGSSAAGVAPGRPLLPTMHTFSPMRVPLMGFPMPVGAGVAAQVFPQELDAVVVLVTASLQRQTNKNVTATNVGVTASIVKQVNKAVTATTVLVTASIVKQVNKALTATAVVVTASLLAMKVILKALTATAVVVTASIVKQVNKPLSATAVAVTASLVKQVNKTLTATTVVVTATLTAIRVFLKSLTATSVVVSASMVRQVGKPLVATSVAVTGSLVKQVGKLVRATNVAVTGSLVATKILFKTMTATVAVSASMVRQVGKPLSVTVTASATVAKRMTKTLSASVSATASLVANYVAQLIGPFAAALVLADLQNTGIAVTDLAGPRVSVADTTNVQATVTDAGTTTATAADVTGAKVTVTDVAP